MNIYRTLNRFFNPFKIAHYISQCSTEIIYLELLNLYKIYVFYIIYEKIFYINYILSTSFINQNFLLLSFP